MAIKITLIEKTKAKVSMAFLEIENLKKQKLCLNKKITAQEDILREVRQACLHPQEFVENTSMEHFKKCTICEDLLFRP